MTLPLMTTTTTTTTTNFSVTCEQNACNHCHTHTRIPAWPDMSYAVTELLRYTNHYFTGECYGNKYSGAYEWRKAKRFFFALEIFNTSHSGCTKIRVTFHIFIYLLLLCFFLIKIPLRSEVVILKVKVNTKVKTQPLRNGKVAYFLHQQIMVKKFLQIFHNIIYIHNISCKENELRN